MSGQHKMHARLASREGQAGFTLIELLVSLMILTLILSFIPGTLRIGQRIWETDEAYERRAALSSFRRYVEDRLAEAIPIHRRDLAKGTLIEFTGEPDRIAFVAPAAAGPAGGGVYNFELREAEGGARNRPLVLRQALYRYGGPIAAKGEDEPSPSVIEHRTRGRGARLALRYFGAPEPQLPPRWQARWPRIDRLPDLVELSFISQDRTLKVERTVVPLRLKTAQ